jgi:recombination protein RecA
MAKSTEFKPDKRATKEKNIQLAIDSLNAKYGQDTVYTLGSKSEIKQIPRISTGIEDLDNILGGGLPKGRIIEIFGPESAGKTTLAYHLMAQCETAMDIPIEGTFDSERAKVFGNKPGQLFISRAEVGEDALHEGYVFTIAGGDMVVVDSVPSLITRKEFEENDFEKEGQRGRIAALLTSKLPKIVHKAEDKGTTWIFINQLRDEMNAMMFGPTTHTPGGRALKHYCSIRMQVNRVEYIKIPNKYNISNSAKELIVGIIIKVKVVKSKVCNPLGECELPIFFDRGFVSYDDVDKIRKELIQKQKEEAKINNKQNASDDSGDNLEAQDELENNDEDDWDSDLVKTIGEQKEDFE